MPSDHTVSVRAGRSSASRDASHVHALRYAGRVAARETPRPHWGRIVMFFVLGLGATGALVAVVAILVFNALISVLSVGLPDPARLETLTFAEPTTIYDRSGKVELGQFGVEDRRVVAFDAVPPLVLDATTTAEDRTFWTNSGFDAAAIAAAAAEGANGTSERGASTITQQLVRARLLPSAVTQPGADKYVRKAKEIIQSMRLSDEFPGELGKERIITAYLNEIFYGHGAYGIAAAAQVYFGVSDLAKLTPMQAAVLAGLPKSPTTLDPYRYAKNDAKGRLVVPADSPPVVRADWILGGLGQGARWTKLPPNLLQAELASPVILAGDQARVLRAAQFTWQVRTQLEGILGDQGANAVETGGYTVITTLDWKAQQLAEKWLAAAAIAPNLSRTKGAALLKSLKIPAGDLSWIRALRGKDLHNAALVALDYTTGDVLAYAGSAGYERDDLASAKFQPKFDVAGDGSRQPGSAWKPILYASAFDSHKLTPGSLLLDVTTKFDARQDWVPRDADQLERGPVLVRKALQYSLNIPAIRALQRVGNSQVDKTAEALGIRFIGGRQAYLQAGLAGAIGTVEVRPLDLTAAYGGLANGGDRLPPQMILEIRGPDGTVVWKAPDPTGTQAVSPQAAYQVTDILAGNTDKKQNPIWSAKLALHNGKGGTYRPAAVKTGTASEAADLATYGYLAPPADSAHPGLVVGIWMGNSDHSNPRSKTPATSLTAAAPLWRAFVTDYTSDWPVTSFRQPPGLVRATIDAWTGGAPGPWTRARTTALFIAGTQPGAGHQIDPPGLLYSQSCGGYRVDLVKAELGPTTWDIADADWMRRARSGPGTRGQYDSRTAYFWGRSSWGGPIAGSCSTSSSHRGGHRGPQHPVKDKHGKPPHGIIVAPSPSPSG
jgi:penicillin-binding protein 1A